MNTNVREKLIEKTKIEEAQEQLRECPTCSANASIAISNTDPKTYRVYCFACPTFTGMWTSTVLCDTIDEAVDNWNHRKNLIQEDFFIGI